MKYIIGDLLKLADDGQFDVIVHGCNCFNTMGAGIAASIRQRAPQAYAADCQTIKGDRNKLEHILQQLLTICFLLLRRTIIIVYTQYTYWDVDDMLSYDAVRNVMQRIKEDFDKGDDYIPRIGAPLICCGLAQGDWNKIEQIIKDTGFRDVTIVVWNDFELIKINRNYVNGYLHLRINRPHYRIDSAMLGKQKYKKNRFYKHLNEAKSYKSKSHKDNWLRSLLKYDLKPIISVIDIKRKIRGLMQKYIISICLDIWV